MSWKSDYEEILTSKMSQEDLAFIQEQKDIRDKVMEKFVSRDDFMLLDNVTGKMRKRFINIFPQNGSTLWHYVVSNMNNSGEHYHDIRHVANVIKNILLLDDWLADGNNRQMAPHKLSRVLLAALFHDFRHSCGSEPEFLNINRAVNMFVATEDMFPLFGILNNNAGHISLLIDELCIKNPKPAIDQNSWMELKEEMMAIATIINGTKFPYNDPHGLVISPELALLRDCDRLSTSRINHQLNVYFGLFNEHILRQRVTFQEFCKNQVDFANSFEYYHKDMEAFGRVNHFKSLMRDSAQDVLEAACEMK